MKNGEKAKQAKRKRRHQRNSEWQQRMKANPAFEESEQTKAA